MNQDSTDKSQGLKAQNKKYFIRIIVLTVINMAMFSFVPFDNRTVYERFMVALPAFIILQPIIGFILGAIVSLIPYKEFGYSKKYLRSSLLVIYILHVLISVMMVIGLIFIFLNS
jgi:hypothetical protein